MDTMSGLMTSEVEENLDDVGDDDYHPGDDAEDEEDEEEAQEECPEAEIAAEWVTSLDDLADEDVLGDGLQMRIVDLQAGHCLTKAKREKCYEDEENEADQGADGGGHEDGEHEDGDAVQGADGGEHEDGDVVAPAKRRKTSISSVSKEAGNKKGAGGKASKGTGGKGSKTKMTIRRPAAAEIDGPQVVMKRPSTAVEEQPTNKPKANPGKVSPSDNISKTASSSNMSPAQGEKETKRRDLLKARKFHSLMANGLIPDAVREEYDNIESNKGNIGYQYRNNMTDLIEG